MTSAKVFEKCFQRITDWLPAGTLHLPPSCYDVATFKVQALQLANRWSQGQCLIVCACLYPCL